MKPFAAVLAIACIFLSLLIEAQTRWQVRYPLPTPYGLLGGTYANGTLQNVRRLPDGIVELQVSTVGPRPGGLQIEAASQLSPADWKPIPVDWGLIDPSRAHDVGAQFRPRRFYRVVTP